MIKIKYLFCISAATWTIVCGVGDMGKGKWSTVSVDKCEEGEFECDIEVVRRKHNRTLDVFDITLDCDKDIDDSIGAVITICKHVDGGCKEWQVLSDDSVPRFGKKYAEGNVKRGLEMAGIDPPDFPIKAGKHSITDFVLDYCEFPKDCVYGRFTALSNLVQDGKNIACVQATVEFDEDNEGNDCE